MSTKQNVLPVAGALCGALVWGLIWYPYRVLQEAGVSGALATLITYLLAMMFGLFMIPSVLRELRMDLKRTGWWALLLLLSAGWTNFGYVLAILYGEVMRVLLLFYLAPLWTILLAYWIQGERLNRDGFLVISLSFSGAVIMLWKKELGLPLPNSMAEWVGLSAGIAFALSNVVSRRAAHMSLQMKSHSVWMGTILLTVPLLLWQGGLPDKLLMIDAQSWVLLALLGIVLCCSTFALQYALANLLANHAIILLLFELVVAAFSSYFLADETMQLRDWLGAFLIVSASLLSAQLHRKQQAA